MLKKYLFIRYLLPLFFFMPILVYSQETRTLEQHVEHSPDHEGWKTEVLQQPDNFQVKFMNMVFILALLIAFMVLASWSLKRMMKSRITQINQSSIIKVLETRHLSPKATLYLVDIDGKSFLIGESPSSLNYLATLSSEEEKVQ